jgi:two-component system NtrC family sensor kinase
LFQSLFLKISVSVGAVVTLTWTFFSYFLIENQRAQLLYAKSQEIETLSALFSRGIMNYMMEGRDKNIHNFINLFGISDHLLEVRILSEDGNVLHSSRREEEGTSMASLILPGTLREKKPPVLEQKIHGRPFLGILQTLGNQPACFSCHGRRKKILGILHVSLPMEATNQIIRFNRNLLIACTAITLLLMALAINLLLSRLVRKPTSKLMETMSLVEKGDLNVKVELASVDELGRLAQNFNSMVHKLSTAQKEVERQHRQQMLQVQHLASLGELAASVAHEIRNPLAGVKLAIELLFKDPGMTAGHRATIGEIMRSIERLDKTMADLLLYSRVSPPRLQAVSLGGVIGEALSSLKEEFRAGRIRVEKRFDPALPPLLLDREQLVGVFLNLFLNALQAMPNGGELQIEAQLSESDHLLQIAPAPPKSPPEEKGWAKVTVTDTGEGIPPEVLPEIFRSFFTTKAKGTGLGLSLCRRVVLQHHGHIFARSQVGLGSTFFLFFPLLQAGRKERFLEGKNSRRG